jgi:hypothetical protein
MELLANVTLNRGQQLRLANFGMRQRWSSKAPMSVDQLLENLESQNLLATLEHLQKQILDGGTNTNKGRKTRRTRRPMLRVLIARTLWAQAEALCGLN